MVLSIAKLKSPSYYLELAREDYYLEGGEPPGHWLGRGAELLALSETVEREALKNLFAGFSADGETKLVQNAGASNRQPGWDLTFSAPKSVSVLWSQSPPAVRRTIQEAQAKAVASALRYLEESAAYTRRGQGGAGPPDRAVLIAAAFEHGTSRAQDPQLHTHVLVLNATVRPDGSTGSLVSHPLYQAKMAAGALYRAELAWHLERDLGVQTIRSGPFFELADVPAPLIDTFSTRRKEIEASLKASGHSGAKAAKIAALETRGEKEHKPRADLFEAWQAIGISLGFTPERAAAAIGKAHSRLPNGALEDLSKDALRSLTRRIEDDEVGNQGFLSAMVNTLRKRSQSRTREEYANHSYFSELDLTRILAEAAQTRGLNIADVMEARDELIRGGELLYLGKQDGVPLFTTPEILRLEEQVLEIATSRQAERTHAVSDAAVLYALSHYPTLTAEQRESLIHLTRGDGGVQLLSGYAGTGKSFLFSAAREAWENEGLKVLGAAPSARAARSLEEGSKIESMTIHRMLIAIENRFLQLTDKTVLVIDEAAMVDTSLLLDVLKVAGNARAKVVLSGDEKQLLPIGLPGAFAALAEKLPVTALHDIQRQQEPWAREAVREIAEGDAARGLRAFFDRGYLAVTETRGEAITSLIDKWQEVRGSPKDALILAATRAEVEQLNQEAQSRLFSHADGTDCIIRPEGSYFLGDRIRFTENDYKAQIENGTFGTIVSIPGLLKSDGLTVRLDDGREVTVPALDAPYTLGYAATTHAAQGVTLERAFVLLGSSMHNRNLTYVQASRARQDTYFAVDRESAGEFVERVFDQARSPDVRGFASSVEQLPPRPDLEFAWRGTDGIARSHDTTRREIEDAEKRERATNIPRLEPIDVGIKR